MFFGTALFYYNQSSLGYSLYIHMLVSTLLHCNTHVKPNHLQPKELQGEGSSEENGK